MATTTNFPAATILGYPRIGPNRELKRALESYWAGRSDESELIEAATQLRAATRQRLTELGLGTTDSSVPADFTYYDQVLSVSTALGVVPTRFNDLLSEDGSLDLAGYFTVARGDKGRPALEMTKWFDSNYHYLVPEISPDTQFKYIGKQLAGQVRESKAQGLNTRPVLVGPVTYLLLAKAAAGSPAGFSPLDKLPELLPAYADLLADLAEAGASWVQLDEPALTSDTWEVPPSEVLKSAQLAYQQLSPETGGTGETGETGGTIPQIFVAGTYGSLGPALPVLAATGIAAVGLDLVAGELPSAAELAGWAGRTIVAGVVSGRNIWRTDLSKAWDTLEELQRRIPAGTNLSVSSSTSLQHVPHDVTRETALDPQLRQWLAFADQKVGETLILARGLQAGAAEIAADIAHDAQIRSKRAVHPGVNRSDIRAATAAVTEADRTRIPYAQRKPIQDAALQLPLLPTTTIGSFPQTTEIRQARSEFRRGQISSEAYRTAMEKEIKQVVELQEKIGLDVLVHGEAERNDMVQYFAELLDGFVTTTHGWVQSYGSRCTRPSILWGDVSRPAPMTVEWSAYAASLTQKPMKGMLTGPVTIMAWSFIRDDIARSEVADQLGLALRDEVADLEAAGINIVQVDEPAIRELLPLRAAQRPAYLEWSLGAFRLATGGALPATQIHTHLCYSEFTVVVEAIDSLDADVTSIEASRSRMEILPAVAEHGFERQLGPGIYDIHSPRVPDLAEQVDLLRRAVAALGVEKVWVNPDCGLKTRGYAEVVPTLENMVAAAQTVRDQTK